MRTTSLCVLAFVTTTHAAPVVVALASNTTISVVQSTYASWNIDPSCNRGFHHTAFTNPNLLAAATGLQPSRLRFGGSGADNLVYGLSPGSPECAGIVATGCDYVTPGCLNSSQWDGLFGLASGSDTDFIFGVSFGLNDACTEGPAYVWNATNVDVLLQYALSKGQQLWGFELGNEVNNNGGAPCNLTARQQAAAFNAFASKVSRTFPNAFLVGPDTGYRAAEQWLRDLLPLVTPGVLHAVTHHVYNGITRKNFNSPAQLDTPLPEISWYTQTIAALAPGAQIWAGEDGPIGGGDDGTCGASSACGTFSTTLWYADDMALRAKHGFVQYQRQDLFGGAYGLLSSIRGDMSLNPTEPVIIRPDYWTAFLWKRLLGVAVLNATSSSPFVRAYAFAGAPPSPFAAMECLDSPLQLLLINLANTSTVITLPAAISSARYSAWTLGPGISDNVFGLDATLNGEALPNVIDSTTIDPRTFLQRIAQPAIVQPVSSGITLSRVSTTFMCYASMYY